MPNNTDLRDKKATSGVFVVTVVIRTGLVIDKNTRTVDMRRRCPCVFVVPVFCVLDYVTLVPREGFMGWAPVYRHHQSVSTLRPHERNFQIGI